MNKFFKYICICIFIVLLFLFVRYGIIPMLLKVANMVIESNKATYTISTRQQDSIKYKSSLSQQDSEREFLDKVMISIASDFAKANSFTSEYDNMDNFYVLQPYFLEYKLYLASKFKVENIAEKLPSILVKTRNFTDTELENYLKENYTEIEKTFGITNCEKLKNLIVATSDLYAAKNIKVSVIDGSIYHDSKSKTIQLGAYLNDTLVNFVFKPYYSTTAQSAPYVSITASAGGVS